MFYFGSAGQIFWSVSNKPADFSTSGTGINIPAGEARPTGAKIIAGRATLGSGVPGGLFWSTNRLLRASYVGGQTTWDFDELATVEILSGRSIVEYNGVYFWIGAGRFMMFDGRVKDVPNTFNKKWFFKRNLNRQYAAKIFGYTVPEHGEIHWSFPKGSSTECNHELVYHVPSGNWWDTPLPLRSAALSPSSTYPYPLRGRGGEQPIPPVAARDRHRRDRCRHPAARHPLVLHDIRHHLPARPAALECLGRGARHRA
jgi:hypothetical protein